METPGGIRKTRLVDLVFVGGVVNLSAIAVLLGGTVIRDAFLNHEKSEIAFFSLTIASGIVPLVSSLLAFIAHRKWRKTGDTGATQFHASDRYPLLAVALSACLTATGLIVLLLALIVLAVVAGQAKYKGLLIFSVVGMAFTVFLFGCLLEVAFQALWVRSDGTFLRRRKRSTKESYNQFIVTPRGLEDDCFQPKSVLEF